MGRIKAFALFALLGFVAGVVVNLVYRTAFPILLKILPEIFRAEWIVSGLVGSILTMIMLVLWAYLSKP